MQASEQRRTLRGLLRLWFGSADVGRGAYATTGFSLMAFKYATDAAFLHAVTGRLWTPLDYLSPMLGTRSSFLGNDGDWTHGVLLLWTLPFVWIGASMTVRRALDAGLSAWTGLLFFAPVLNYFWMLLLCVLPSSGPFAHEGAAEDAGPPSDSVLSDARAAAPAAALGMAAMALSVLVFKSYGPTLFVGLPFAMGFVAGYRRNRAGDRGMARTVSAATLAILFTAGALVLFALEGVICLAMAAPPALVFGIFGAFLGRLVAEGQHRLRASHAVGLLLLFPLVLGAERAGPAAPIREVVSTIEIDAPPEVVWRHVVGFSELPPASRLVFRLGIAHPQRARIEGTGVGATRYCEFSTGPFVEPITVWDEPRRLAFDVVRQPEPMHETSPYQHVHAPHLVDGLVARRGEFRLMRLAGGRTRLEGSTWYQLDMAPDLYWSLYSDALIHAIHARVLEHVKHLAEADRAHRPV